MIIREMTMSRTERASAIGFTTIPRAVLSAAHGVVSTVERAMVGDARVRTARTNAWEALCADRHRAEHRAELRRLVAELAAVAPGTPGEWCQVAIELADGDGRGGIVGDVAFCVHADEPTRASVGYTLAPAHQGNGYATEALAALLDWLAAEHGVTVVEADVLADNAPSRRVLERNGFAPVAELDDGGVLYERRQNRGALSGPWAR